MFSRILNSVQKTRGFTLVEALIAISIFLVLITATTGLFTNAFSSQRKAQVSKIVYEEGRIALERIVKEIRRGTIDYEEYWNRFQHQFTETDDNSVYGLNYGDYSLQFYVDGDGDPLTVSRFDENIGENLGDNPLLDASSLAVCDSTMIPNVPASSDGYEQCELYLINSNGTEKTILKLIPEDIDIGGGVIAVEYHLEMMKLNGSDTDFDGTVDTWTAAADFCAVYAGLVCTTRQFQKIQPNSIQITSLKFYISPLEDPRKAFAEFTDAVQQQPHVTIEMTVEPSVIRTYGIRGEIPSVTLQTTIGARAQNEIKSL